MKNGFIECMLLLYHVQVFGVNPHSIVAWMSRTSLLKKGMISQV